MEGLTSVRNCFLSPVPPTCSVSLHGVPDVAVKVVITGKQQTAGARESHGGDATDDVVVTVDAELLVCAQVEQPAGGVVGACGEGATVGEELRRRRRNTLSTDSSLFNMPLTLLSSASIIQSACSPNSTDANWGLSPNGQDPYIIVNLN